VPRLSRFLFAIVSLGVSDECDDDMRTNRRVFTGASLFVGIAGPFWGAMYIGFGELGPGLIPTIYSAITLVSFVVLWRHGGWQRFRVSQLALIYILPIALMLSLGGYVLGSVVMIWAVLAPLGAGRSQAQLRDGVVFEDGGRLDVAAQDGAAAVAGLAGDGPFGCAVSGGGGDELRAEAMSGQFLGRV